MQHSIAALALLVIINDRFTATRMRPENAILRFGLQQILVICNRRYHRSLSVVGLAVDDRITTATE